MKGATNLDLLKLVRSELSDYEQSYGGVSAEAWAALAELEARSAEEERVGFEWPQKVYDAALSVLGNGVANRSGRVRKALDRKIRHALRAWDDNYGPLTPEQADYAATVLASCFQPQWKLPQIYVRLDRVVSHETVHNGFVRRAGDPFYLEGLAPDDRS